MPPQTTQSGSGRWISQARCLFMAACSFEASPPSPSPFFILRLICFVNVFLPSPSLRADCDSYCKASKGKLKINMKKYCKKDYGECPLSEGGAVPKGCGAGASPRGVPKPTQPRLGPSHSPCWDVSSFGNGFARFGGGAVCHLGNWDEHTVDPGLGVVSARAGDSSFPSVFQCLLG